MTRIGTPLSPTATRVLLCGCGELGKEVVIELQRLLSDSDEPLELHDVSQTAIITTSHFFIVSPSSALDLFCPSLQIPARYSSR